MVRGCIIRAFFDLAKSTSDKNLKRDFGNRGLSKSQKYTQESEDNEGLTFELGEIYFEAFHDYNIALRYFSKIEDPVDNVVKYYIKECKKNGARM